MVDVSPEGKSTESSMAEDKEPTSLNPDIPRVPPTASPSLSLSAPAPKNSKTGLFVGLAALVIVGIASTAALTQFSANNDPEAVVQDAFVNSFASPTVAIDSKIEFDFEGDETPIGDIDLSAVVDENTNMSASLSLNLFVTEVELSFVAYDDTAYFRADGLEGLASLAPLAAGNKQEADQIAQMSEILEVVNDNWYEVDLDLVIPEEERNLVAASEGYAEALDQAYEEFPAIEIREDLGADNVNGLDSFHYQVSFNPVNFAALIERLEELGVEGLDYDEEMISSLEDLQYSNIDVNRYELWIDKESRRINRILVEGPAGDDGAFSVTIDMSYDDIPLVEKPDESRTLLQLFDDLDIYNPDGPFAPGGDLDLDTLFDSGMEGEGSPLDNLQPQEL